jgi:hypothetical protein
MGKDLWPRIDLTYRDLDPGVFLRGADAVHLLTAQAYGFKEIYTNDRQLLRACPVVGLSGRDLLQ